MKFGTGSNTELTHQKNARVQMSTSTHTYIYNNLILNLTPLYGVSLANYIVDYICSGLMPTLQVLL